MLPFSLIYYIMQEFFYLILILPLDIICKFWVFSVFFLSFLYHKLCVSSYSPSIVKRPLYHCILQPLQAHAQVDSVFLSCICALVYFLQPLS